MRFILIDNFAKVAYATDMICRHSADDPNCSSHPNYQNSQTYADEQAYYARLKKEQEPVTPDSENYEIIDVERVGSHIALKVKYPNCAKCAYEGTKILVYLNVSEVDILKWKKIDPHFSNKKRSAREAPSPACRFPASDEGWEDAIVYMKRKRDPQWTPTVYERGGPGDR